MSAADDAHKPLPIAHAIEASWSPQRAEHALERVHERRALQSRARRGALLAVSFLVLLLAGGLAWRAELGARPGPPALEAHRVRFGDGSTVHLLDADSALDVGSASDRAVEVSLRAGRAEFEITPNPARRFVVHA